MATRLPWISPGGPAATPAARRMKARTCIDLLRLDDPVLDISEVPGSEPHVGGRPDVAGLAVEAVLLRVSLHLAGAVEVARIAVPERGSPLFSPLRLHGLELDPVDRDRVGAENQPLCLPDKLRDAGEGPGVPYRPQSVHDVQHGLAAQRLDRGEQWDQRIGVALGRDVGARDVVERAI